jgi:hypothetical protein
MTANLTATTARSVQRAKYTRSDFASVILESAIAMAKSAAMIIANKASKNK